MNNINSGPCLQTAEITLTIQSRKGIYYKGTGASG